MARRLVGHASTIATFTSFREPAPAVAIGDAVLLDKARACSCGRRAMRNRQVGRIPGADRLHADYRDVSGIKMPFRWTVIWLDGQDTVQLNKVRPNPY